MPYNQLDLKDSILGTVKKLNDVYANSDDFDDDLIIHTNTVLFALNQMGIGKEGFRVTDENQLWVDFLEEEKIDLSALKSWLSLKVKMLFDPPISSIKKQSMDELLKEYEWRLYITKNYTDEDFGKVNTKTYSEIKNLQPYTYEIEYKELDYNYAYNYFKNKKPIAPIGGCSSIRNGNFYGRLFDWTYDNTAEFVVKTKDTIGVGQVINLTDELVKSGKDSELYKLLPFFIVDGINKHGVVCNTNVVPNQKGITVGTIPTYGKQVELCSLMLPRYILDHFTAATEAVHWLKDYASIFVPQYLEDMKYEMHFMIADTNNTYCLEFVNNVVEIIDISEAPYMTNFFLHGITRNSDGKVYTPADVHDGYLPSVENGITSLGSGLERYNLIVDNYDGCNDKEGMLGLIKKLLYTNSYKSSTDPFWFTEFVGERNLTVDDIPENYTLVVNGAMNAFANRKRIGASVPTWQTVHATVYDIAQKKMYLIAQEFVDTIYEYTL